MDPENDFDDRGWERLDEFHGPNPDDDDDGGACGDE
jgi:hypothetical protein